jgi:predicted transcriptional regulator
MDLDKEQEIPVLISLHEKYFEEMKQGSKRYEYRRRYLNLSSMAFVYCPNPIKAIKGVVRFGKPTVGTPEEIAVISGRDIKTWDYLKGGDKGYAIPVLAWEDIEPITLEKLRQRFPGFVPQQSFYRLDRKPELLEFLQANRNKKPHLG